MSEKWPELRPGMLVRSDIERRGYAHYTLIRLDGELAMMYSPDQVVQQGLRTIERVQNWCRDCNAEYSPDNGTTWLPYRPEPEPVKVPDEVFVGVYEHGCVNASLTEQGGRDCFKGAAAIQRYTKPLNWRKCKEGARPGAYAVVVYGCGKLLEPTTYAAETIFDSGDRFWIPASELLATLPKE